MYLVVSEWEPLSGHEKEFEEAGMKTGNFLKQQPGVEFLEVFRSGNKTVAVHGYRDEATYRAIVQDPNGPFAQQHAANRAEEHGRFLGSQKGETITRREERLAA